MADDSDQVMATLETLKSNVQAKVRANREKLVDEMAKMLGDCNLKGILPKEASLLTPYIREDMGREGLYVRILKIGEPDEDLGLRITLMDSTRRNYKGEVEGRKYLYGVAAKMAPHKLFGFIDLKPRRITEGREIAGPEDLVPLIEFLQGA